MAHSKPFQATLAKESSAPAVEWKGGPRGFLPIPIGPHYGGCRTGVNHDC